MSTPIKTELSELQKRGNEPTRRLPDNGLFGLHPLAVRGRTTGENTGNQVYHVRNIRGAIAIGVSPALRIVAVSRGFASGEDVRNQEHHVGNVNRAVAVGVAAESAVEMDGVVLDRLQTECNLLGVQFVVAEVTPEVVERAVGMGPHP